MTGYNNLDFWKKYKPEDFCLLYEAYDNALWSKSRYISDSQWTVWKVYDKGVLMKDDFRTPIEHLQDEPQIILLLTHPDCYYSHFHEISSI